MLGVCRDITSEHGAEATLQASEAKFRGLLEHAPHARRNYLRYCHCPTVEAEIPARITASQRLEFWARGRVDGIIRSGSMITYVIEYRTGRFDANPRVAVKAQLRISSKMLRVARPLER